MLNRIITLLFLGTICMFFLEISLLGQDAWDITPIPTMVEDETLISPPDLPNPGTVTFTIDQNLLNNLDLGSQLVYFTEQDMSSFLSLLNSDTYAMSGWNKLTTKTITALNYQFDGSDEEIEKYIYSFYDIHIPAFIWMCTGSAQVGAYLKTKMLEAARRPTSFWVHDYLRAYDPDFPKGGLETAISGASYATAWYWTQGLWTASESELIQNAIRIKIFYPVMRWLDRTHSLYTNWHAAIAGNAIVLARILNEPEAEAIALNVLQQWLGALEDDGSYSEPLSYLDFGLGHFLTGALATGASNSISIAQSTNLKGTLNYFAYNYCYANQTINGQRGIKVNYGDGDFPGEPNQAMCYYLAYAFNQGLGLWLNNQYPKGYSFQSLLMKIMFSSSLLQPVSPGELELPAAKFFDCGVGFIRLGWEKYNETMLAIRSGGGGKTEWAHDYRNRNALMLVHNGELFLTNPGRASYRNTIHETWDKLATSHNLITFGDNDQKTYPVAETTAVVDSNNYAYIASEAYESYYLESPRCRKMLREIIGIKDQRIFVMRDSVSRQDNDMNINLRYYFNNYDYTGVLSLLNSNTIQYTRNNIAFKVYSATNGSAVYSTGQGIMHIGYSYFPGDPNEGELGSSILWKCSNTAMQADNYFYSVLGEAGWAILQDTVDGYEKLTVEKGDHKYEIMFPVIKNGMLNSIICKHYENSVLVETNHIHSVDKKGLIFSGYNICTYDSSADLTPAQYEISEDGKTFHLWGNNWKAFDLTSIEIKPETILEFDFKCDSPGEIHGIGFETETNTVSPPYIFKINGTQNWSYAILDYDSQYTTNGEWQHYMIPVGKHLTGLFQYLTFINDHDGGATSNISFRNVHLYTPEAPALKLSNYTISSYDSSADVTSTQYEFLDNGTTLHMWGNNWKAIDLLKMSVQRDTVIEFDMKCNIEGDITGIGLEVETETISPPYIFKLHGTQDWSYAILDYDNQYTTGIGWKHYVLPVGEYLTGNFRYLVFANDHDGSATSDVCFKNIRIYNAPVKTSISLADYTISTYDPSQDITSTQYEFENDGLSLHLWGNNWKALDLTNINIQAGTILEFDFKCDIDGDINGIGFETETQNVTAGYIFQLHGSQVWGIQDYDGQYTTGAGWKHYIIPVGEYLSGTYRYLTFANDDDDGIANSDVRFKNIKIYTP